MPLPFDIPAIPFAKGLHWPPTSTSDQANYRVQPRILSDSPRADLSALRRLNPGRPFCARNVLKLIPSRTWRFYLFCFLLSFPRPAHHPDLPQPVQNPKMTRTAGLIGGMSWQTTALYYSAINTYVRAKLGGIHSAKLLISSIDYADIASFVTSSDSAGMADMLSTAAQQLKNGGAQSLVLCANVAHKAADAIEKRTALPVLHIADFTGQAIVQRGFRKVGLIATRAVMEEEFYKARLGERYGLEVFVPGKEFREKVDGFIFHELSKQPVEEGVRRSFEEAYQDLLKEYQVDCIVLACTELRLVFDVEKMRVPVFETVALHARGVADWALSDG